MSENSRVFTIKEQLRLIRYASKSFVALKKNKDRTLMNKKLKERIMLAITQVNGCEMCSFVHTKIALSTGMPRENINAILEGDISNVPDEDAVAVMYGQHFADSKEKPSIEARERLIEEYGPRKANLIKAATYMITMTNGMGTSLDYLWSRLRFKRNKKSNIVKEVVIPLSTMLLFPPLVLYNMIICLFSRQALVIQ